VAAVLRMSSRPRATSRPGSGCTENFAAACGPAIAVTCRMNRRTFVLLGLGLSLIALCGCQDLIPHDPRSVLFARFHRSEIIGFVAGFGTTFAALPDLIAMLRRRSSAGINARMVAILGVFQILWVYYGLLIASRPVVAWNVVAVLVNSLSVWAYFHFAPKERA
jgi:MtN3 and saliva related transmembrane protein